MGCPNCGNSRCCVPQRGERGLQGPQGPQGEKGDQGDVGPQGPAGNDGQNAILDDTGWIDLQGFDHLQGSMATEKPQARRIGKVIYFRGWIRLPLSNDGGATLIPWTTGTGLESQHFVAPYTGAGGVTLTTAGALQLNNNGIVVPSAVWNGNLDDSYQKRYTIGGRQVKINNDAGHWYTTVVNIIVLSDRSMWLTCVRDAEELSTVGGPTGVRGEGSSPLRYLCSYAEVGKSIRDYRSNGAGDSTLHQIEVDVDPADIGSDRYVGNLGNLQHPITIDAGEVSNLGGFSIPIDGLTAFIA